MSKIFLRNVVFSVNLSVWSPTNTSLYLGLAALQMRFQKVASEDTGVQIIAFACCSTLKHPCLFLGSLCLPCDLGKRYCCFKKVTDKCYVLIPTSIIFKWNLKHDHLSVQLVYEPEMVYFSEQVPTQDTLDRSRTDIQKSFIPAYDVFSSLSFWYWFPHPPPPRM